MPTNDFLPFATGGGADVQSQADYVAASSTSNGFSNGIAEPDEVNKVWRQSSVLAHVVAQFISDTLAVDVLDDGDVAALLANYILAINHKITEAQEAAPAVSVYNNAVQSVPDNVDTKLIYNTEIFDTAGAYTANRFTPLVAGYYQVSVGQYIGGMVTGVTYVKLFKSGAEYCTFGRAVASATFNAFITGSALVYMNGTTDYLEVFLKQNSGGAINEGDGTQGGQFFTAALIRKA